MVLNRYTIIKIEADAKARFLATQKLENIVTSDTESAILVFTTGISNKTNDFGIANGSMSIDSMICSSGLKFGEVNSTKFEAELFNLTENVCGRKITVTVIDNDAEHIIFTGIIESSTTDKSNISRKIVAYDMLYYLRELDVAEWWNSYWENIEATGTTATLKNLAHSLYTSLDIEHEEKDLLNDNMIIEKYNDFTSIKFGDVLRMICELNCCFPHITGDGSLEFITLDMPDDESEVISNYEADNSDFADYITKPITGVNIYGKSDELSETCIADSAETDEETENNFYPIVGNILLLSSKNISDIGKLIHSYIRSIEYTPCDINMIVSDLTMSLGDALKTTQGTHFIMSLTFEGPMFVDSNIKCVADGETLNQQISTRNDTMIEGRLYSSFVQTIDSITSEVGNIQDKFDGHTEAISQLKQTADNIQMNFVRKDSKEYVDLTTNIVFDADGIDIKGNNATTGETSSLHLGTDSVVIRDSSNSEVASMQANEFRTSEWIMQQTRNNTIFNIFRRH